MMNQDEKGLVIARIQRMPGNRTLNIITPKGTWSGGREEIIAEIEKESDIGERIVNIHMYYLRSFKDSEFWKQFKGPRGMRLKTQ